MTEQEAREDEREALMRDLMAADAWRAIVDMNAPTLAAVLHADGYRKRPEPEITAREDMADFPVGTIARDMIGRVFVRTDAHTYRWRTILGAGYDLSDDQATTYTPVRILWVPVGEGEHGCPYCEEVRRMDATYGSQIGVCIKHRTQPVPPAAPDWMPRIGGETA